MTRENTRFESPVAAILLIHKALRTEATHVENMVNNLEIGDSLQPFNLAFYSWATALVYHAEQEDRFMMAYLNHNGPSDQDPPGLDRASIKRDGSLGTLAKDDASDLLSKVGWAMVAQEEKLHQQLLAKVEDVLTVLQQDIGQTSLIPRTIQHLYQGVVALRISLEDHLETEEALVLPVIRRRMDEAQQARLARSLLIDDGAQHTCWMLDWVRQRLTHVEQEMLAELEERFGMTADQDH